MCGICGIIDKNNRNINKENLASMTKFLAHRGPDGEGIYIHNNMGLGHRRLSIIDLSDNAKQPMSNEDGTVWVVFNGMIYNYKALREELIQKGHQFKSHSDTEVIIHLYEERGKDCIKSLRGMFAFALWDAIRKKIILVRDRVGQKPLVYAQTKDFFLFASEPKAIFASGLLSKEIDIVGMQHSFSYMNVPWPYTMYKNIKQLPPASVLDFDLHNNLINIDKYWKIDLGTKLKITVEEASNRLVSLLEESVKLQLISDVSLGAFLSGGVDSSTVVALMSKFSSKPVETFSIGFEAQGKNDPEFRFSKKISSIFKTNHHQVSVDHNIINNLSEMLMFYDEPYANPVALLNFELCRTMKKDVTVALSGDGADEIFAGYSGYRNWKAVHIFNKLFPVVLSIERFNLLGKNRASEVLRFLFAPPERKRSLRKNIFNRGACNNLYSAKVIEATKEINTGRILEEFYHDNNSDFLLDNILFMDLVLYNAHGVSLLADISGMSNGMEIRAPFLDHKLIEFVFSLPSNTKINRLFKTKYILRKAVSGILPRLILERKKIGYGEGVPFDRWFCNEWKPQISQILFDGGLRESGLFKLDYVKSIFDNHIKQKQDNFNILWPLVCFSVWYENTFVKN